MSAPTVVATSTLTFGGTTYKLKSILGGQPKSCEAIDVTCLDDDKKQFVKGALIVNDDISAVIAGDSCPTINTKNNLTISVGTSSVDCGDCVVKSVEASTIEANGNREQTWDVVFTPCGEDPSSNSNS